MRAVQGIPRGFWARGERWVAHGGSMAEIRVDGGEPDRFREVRERAAELLSGAEAHGPDDPRLAGRLRLYGGFSFRDDHRPAGSWTGFPQALFLLPRLELEGDAEGVGRLRIRASLGDGDDPERLRTRLGAELEALRERLLSDDGDTGGGGVGGRRAESERGPWEDAVREALRAIETGELSKAVLARTLDIETDRTVDPVAVARALWGQNRGTHVFLFEPVVGRALVGAAPETVATVRSRVFHATAVAGSTHTGENEEERRRLARALLESHKDRAEQRIVVEDMRERLEAHACSIRVEDEPHVLTLARIQHLETEIRARLDPEVHVLEVLGALHPTPAVCGLPRDAALRFLKEEEPFDRGWYAGPVGWFDDAGNGVFAPALRSGLAEGRTWRLFAGAGIVSGSRPSDEWEETRIKFEPVLQAIAASGVRR